MRMFIKRLDIYTSNGKISFSFNDRITFIYGNIGVGKSTLLSVMLFCLGGDLVETPAVSDQFVSAEVHVELNKGMYLFRREYRSSRIFVNDKQGNVYNIEKKKISDFLYRKSNIQGLYYEREGSDTPNQLTFRNFLWYVYLKQSDIDSNFFYLGKGSNEFYQIASINALASLLEKESFVSEEQKKILSKKRKRFRKYENGKIALDYVINAEFIDYITTEYNFIKEEEYDFRSINVCQKDNKERILRRVILNYNKFLREYNDLKRQVESFSFVKSEDADIRFKQNLHELGEIFKECLISIGFPSISKSDKVEYDERTLNPIIFNEYTNTKYSFELLGSGGKKTLFKICFLLAIHIKANEENLKQNSLPSLIIIDTPMKNISEREDKELFDNFYLYLLKLSETKLSDTQMIIIDKEKNNIITDNNANIISISKEHPLFPEFVDVNLWRI